MKLYKLWIAFLVLGMAKLTAQEDCCEPTVCCEAPTEEAPICRGKIEFAPTYVHIDFLQKGHTHHTADYAAIRGDFGYRIWQGLLLRPVVMYGVGKGDNEILTGGIGVGFCLPFVLVPKGTKFTVTPLLGVNWGYIRGSFEQDNPMLHGHKLKIKERFRSRSPYVGIEVCWTICKGWRFVGSYQYAWSRTHNKITFLENAKSSSNGNVYSGMLEHDFNDCFSMNLGAAYNDSLSHERDGVRGWGMKLGFAYWY